MTVDRSTWAADMARATRDGSAIMLAQTPAVTALNRVSVVSCREGVAAAVAATRIFRGEIDQTARGVHNFGRGVSGHLVKETARVGAKASGVVFKPRIEAAFPQTRAGKMQADFTFAGLLSAWEIVINPADTLRTMWQAGERFTDIPSSRRLAHLYTGAGANGVRQFGTWLGFAFADRTWTPVTRRVTDPDSLGGNALRALPQSAQLTIPVWIFERLKNEAQYRPELGERSGSRYVRAFQHIRETQGWRGFANGLSAKIWSNAVLVFGVNILLAQGRKAMAAREKES